MIKSRLLQTCCFIKVLLLSLPIVTASSQVYSQEKLDSDSKELYESMLAGGALKTCSSFSQSNCKVKNFSNEIKKEILYELNDISLNRLDLFIQTTNNSLSKNLLKPIYEKLQKLDKYQAVNKNTLFDILEENKLYQRVNTLPDSAYYALLDHLELKQITPKGERKKEIANVLQSNSEAAIQIYQRFVEQVTLRAKSQNTTPHILVVTASSRDAFEVVDFYTSVFSSLNIKTTWLPINPSLSHAIELSNLDSAICEKIDKIHNQYNLFDRERLYPELYQQQVSYCKEPELLEELINSAQGIFINGGDQSKTLNSITTSTYEFHGFWKRVLHKVSQKELIVGGTSAGAAVQAGKSFNRVAIPMISNGISKNAIERGAFAALAPSIRCTSNNCDEAILADDLTYMPSGGANTFTVGTVDTHFSERDREGRLIVLALSQRTRLAVGVDETTAMFYSKNNDVINLEVVGENGVFMIDGQNSMLKMTNVEGNITKQYAGYAHYLPNGVEAALNLNTNNWSLSNNIQMITKRKTLNQLDDGIWRNSTRKYCGTSEPIAWEIDSNQYLVSPNKDTQFFIDANRKYCGYLYLPFLVQ